MVYFYIRAVASLVFMILFIIMFPGLANPWIVLFIFLIPIAVSNLNFNLSKKVGEEVAMGLVIAAPFIGALFGYLILIIHAFEGNGILEAFVEKGFPGANAYLADWTPQAIISLTED